VLEFIKYAKEEFSFLVSEYGFTIASEAKDLLEYETQDVIVHVGFYGYAFELYINIGHKKITYDGNIITFSINEILGYKNSPEQDCPFQAASPEKLEILIKEIASLYKKYAQDFLLGQKDEFNNLLANRNQKTKDYALIKQLKLMREKADKAWRNKSFPEIIKLFSEFEEHLTESERKKLEYARKSCN
jgi:hypothetical protein